MAALALANVPFSDKYHDQATQMPSGDSASATARSWRAETAPGTAPPWQMHTDQARRPAGAAQSVGQGPPVVHGHGMVTARTYCTVTARTAA